MGISLIFKKLIDKTKLAVLNNIILHISPVGCVHIYCLCKSPDLRCRFSSFASCSVFVTLTGIGTIGNNRWRKRENIFLTSTLLCEPSTEQSTDGLKFLSIVLVLINVEAFLSVVNTYEALY